jgi:hypothetical protein
LINFQPKIWKENKQRKVEKKEKRKKKKRKKMKERKEFEADALAILHVAMEESKTTKKSIVGVEK